MELTEIKEKDGPDRKGGLYCTPTRIAFCVLSVCVLLTVTALMAYFVPDRSPIQLPSAEAPTTAPTARPTVDPSDLMKGRLPKTVLPRRYELNLRPFLYDDDVPDSKLGERFTFDGWVRIKVECMEATDEITLHCKNITIHGMPTVHSVSTLDNTDIFESYKMIEEYSFLVLKLKEMLRPHEDYDIYMTYSGTLRTEYTNGFYVSNYITSQNITRYIATTQMAGPRARRVLPCFDEPTFKASYDVQLEHRKDMSALSNGIDIRRIQLDSHWSRTYFKRVPSMPTYLLAFVVHDFSSINVTNAHGCLIRIWCETELIHLAPYALNVSDLVQVYLDDYLDYEFPFDKQDHIAVQDFEAGAMENWGLIIYKDRSLLNGLVDFGDSTYYSKIITHELAHMWFGNLVTLEWWNDVWLNEGFATYMEHIGQDRVHPEFGKFESFYVDIMDRALHVDSLGTFKAIRAPIYANDDDINGIFTSIPYRKGGSILWMMEHFLTLDVFNQGIRNYLKERAYKNVNSEDLWEELTYADKNVGKHDVKRIMDTWTLQPGYPLITLTRTGQDVVAKQKRFLQITDGETTEDSGYLWYVPLTYVYKSGPSDQFDQPEQVWMEPKEYTYFTLPDEAASDDWYLANAKMVGLYRVNYEDDNWQRLLDQAAKDPDVFGVENSVGLIYDTFNLAKAEVIPNYIHQNFSTYLGLSSPSARRSVVETSSYFAKMLLSGNRRQSSSSTVQTYMQQLLKPLYENLDWNTGLKSDVHISRGMSETELDVTSLACFYGNSHYISKTTTMFKDYVNDPTLNKVHPNLRAAVYCSGIRYGGQSEWDFGWHVVQTTNDRHERSRWISALTCSRSTLLLKSNLLTGGATTFSAKDTELILMGLAENPDGYEIAWDFIRNNWEEVYTMYKENQLPRLVDAFEEITSHFNTRERLRELLDFGQSRHLGHLKYANEAAVTSTRVNIRWMSNSADQTEQWMRSLVYNESN
ncbi:aminopeptidase N-like [Asterias amurensis]|uniref:aminopeptidase N-like n=1 Tax=Asterias amurensis TaxID=7602 RepID=UPI003AB749E4